MKKLHSVVFSLSCALALVSQGCSTQGPSATSDDEARGKQGDRPTVAYVTNGIASFWVIAEKGARDAAEEFDVNVEVLMPPQGVNDQQRMVEDVLTRGVDGIAISPIDPDNQQALLNDAASKTHLITHDSDAPNTNRLCYVGMDNYDAGRMCGELVKEAMPDGGSIMIFVGRIEQLNARQRRQGLIDELQGDSAGGKYQVLDTRTDNFDFAAAKARAEDAIVAYPELGCMVGLFEYNPPQILEALRGAGRLGEIQVVAFDENEATLEAIKDGHCYGTVVQNPYRYGYESVRILAGLAREDESVLPEGGTLYIPARKITKNNVDEFHAELKALTKP